MIHSKDKISAKNHDKTSLIKGSKTFIKQTQTAAEYETLTTGRNVLKSPYKQSL